MLEGYREPENPWFLDEIMLERFGRFCSIAEKHGMKLIVGLITGWMSGRLFIPAALYGKNMCTDPTALKFELLMVRGMVSRFSDRSAIYAWNLGNECNCMSEVSSREEAMVWTAAVSNAIRAADPGRPVGKESGTFLRLGYYAEICFRRNLAQLFSYRKESGLY